MSRPALTKLEPLAGPVAAVALAHILLVLLVWIFLPLWQAAHPNHAAELARLDWKKPDDFLLGGALSPEPAAVGKGAWLTPPPPPSAPAPAVAASSPSPESSPPLPPSVGASSSSSPSSASPASVAKAPAVAPQAPLVDHTATVMAPPPAGPTPAPAPPANKYITVSAKKLSLFTPAGAPNTAAASAPAPGPDMGPVENAIQKAYLKEWVAPAIQYVPAGHRSATLDVSISRNGTILEAKVSKPAGAPALDISILDSTKRVTKIPVSLPSSFPKERYDLQVNFQIE